MDSETKYPEARPIGEILDEALRELGIQIPSNAASLSAARRVRPVPPAKPSGEGRPKSGGRQRRRRRRDREFDTFLALPGHGS